MSARLSSGKTASLLVLAFLSLLGACVTDDKITGEREALGAIREVFETRVRGDGSLLEGARVTSITRFGIEWTDDGPVRRLAWSDLEDVEYQQDQERPVRPEALYLFLARGSPSVAASGAIQPPLAGAEVVRCYVMLRDRPKGSRSKLVRALKELGRSVKPGPEPVEAAAPTSASRTTEEKLTKLKELHEKGLISDEVYAEEQRRVLSQGY